MASTTFVPRFVYGTGPTTLILTWPMKLWDLISKGEGGMNVSTAGIPEAFELRRDEKARITIRFSEAEWPNVRTMLINLQQTQAAFTFYFQNSPALPVAGFPVYLDKPAMGEDIAPKRADAKGIFELDLVIRSTTSSSLYIQAF